MGILERIQTVVLPPSPTVTQSCSMLYWPQHRRQVLSSYPTSKMLSNNSKLVTSAYIPVLACLAVKGNAGFHYIVLNLKLYLLTWNNSHLLKGEKVDTKDIRNFLGSMGIALTEREELKLLKSLPIASEYLACRWVLEGWMGYCGRPGWEWPWIRSPCLVCVLIWQWETSPLYSASEPWVNSVTPPPTPTMYLMSVCTLGNLPSPHNPAKR